MNRRHRVHGLEETRLSANDPRAWRGFGTGSVGTDVGQAGDGRWGFARSKGVQVLLPVVLVVAQNPPYVFACLADARDLAFARDSGLARVIGRQCQRYISLEAIQQIPKMSHA